MPGTTRSLTAEQERKVATRYTAGESPSTIAAALGVAVSTIRRTLQRLNVDTKPEAAKFTRRLTDKEKVWLVEKHLSGARLEDVARDLGITAATAWRTVKAFDAGKGRGRQRTRTVRDDAFDTLTRESLYWMGFVFADGSLTFPDDGSPWVAMHISEKDRAHLEAFRAFLGSNHAITRTVTDQRYGGPAVYFKVRSQQLVATLGRCGMTPKKPDRLPVDALADSPDFWRGIVDADGSIGTQTHASGNVYAYFHCAGHPPLLDRFRVFLRELSIDLRRTETSSGGAFKIGTSGSTALAAIRKLYTDAPVALERKLLRAREILAMFPREQA